MKKSEIVKRLEEIERHVGIYKVVDLIPGEWYEIGDYTLSSLCLLKYNNDDLCSGWWDDAYHDNFWEFKKGSSCHKIAKPASKELLTKMGVLTDKFADLKEAHKNGAVIQCKIGNGSWSDCEPKWSIHYEYRIKPEEKPKVGGVCKFWDECEDSFVISRFMGMDGVYFRSLGDGYENSKNVTKEEVIELLFGKETS